MPKSLESRAFYVALGGHVAKIRKARGMTQAKLAKEIAVSQQAIFAYELGQRRLSVLNLARMKHAFELKTVDELIEMGDIPPLAVPKAAKGMTPSAIALARRITALKRKQQSVLEDFVDNLEETNNRRGYLPKKVLPRKLLPRAA